MNEYRIFLIGPDGHIQAADECVCFSDAEACDYARTISTACQSREVWSGMRQVAVLSESMDQRRQLEAGGTAKKRITLTEAIDAVENPR